MRRILVHEYERLEIGVDFSAAEMDALARFNDRYGEKYFQLLHKAVRFKNYVGGLKVGSLQIEILPKLDKDLEEAPLRGALLQLLKHTELLKIDQIGLAQLDLKEETLLSIYLQAFLHSVEQLLQRGLFRSYEQRIQQSKNWKGQIQFPQQLKQAWRQRSEVISKQTNYSYQNHWHRLLYAALRQVLALDSTPKLRKWADRLLMVFPPQEPIQAKKEDFQNLDYDQKRLPYKNAMQLAELILLGYQPQLKTGQLSVFGILFDMNRLYEEYVYRKMQAALELGESLERQSSSPFWANKQLRPDLLLKLGEEQLVLDCKWKLLQQTEPNDQDLRQIYVYQQHFGAKEGWLLYPSLQKKTSWASPFISLQRESATQARIVWLDLLQEDGQLNENLGRELLELARRTVELQ